MEESTPAPHVLPGIHVGIIPDGNRRWCIANNVPVLDLPAMLQTMLVTTVRHAMNGRLVHKFKHLHRVSEISLYVLSKDNFTKRGGSDDTIEMIRQILTMLLAEIERGSLPTLVFSLVGEVGLLPADMQEMCHMIQSQGDLNPTHTSKMIRCTLAIVYDPVHDCRKERHNGFSKQAQTPIDLVIRTGGELRSSGFFPLHTLYSEWVYLPQLFPDLTLEALDKALQEYLSRQRRFGA